MRMRSNVHLPWGQALAAPVQLRRGTRAGFAAFFIALQLMAAPVLASLDSVEDDAVAQVSIDMQPALEALLRKVETQISAGQITTPDHDNAAATWVSVLELEGIFAASPERLRPMTDFAVRMRTRAQQENTAGRSLTASAFTVFADLANEALLNTAEVKPAPTHTPPGADRPTAMNPVSPPPFASAAPSGPIPRADGAGNEAKEMASKEAGPTELAVPVPTTQNPPLREPPPEDSTRAALLAIRGDEKLAIKDISAARKFYEYAANAGNARAAAALARTYDPAAFEQLGMVGLRSDLTKAEAWYRRAADLGNESAEAWLRARSAAPTR